MKSDIEIASAVKMFPIREVAEKTGFEREDIELHGDYIGKVKLGARDRKKPEAKLVLVTAMTPTPSGEGKTTVSIGLSEALNKLGKKSIVTLREPSLGPVFGVKGGAAGGGYSQVLPMTDINLHFTGDIHAVTAAHNLLSALVDNQYARTEKMCLRPKEIIWNRVIDMNDRSLRNIVIGLGKDAGQVRESRFEITASSEIMAILGLSQDITELKERLGNIIIAVQSGGKPLYARDINAQGALAILLKDALKPNLVQTIEHNAALIHTGPFANIAHGTNSLVATDMARRYADIVVVEAGFGSDLGGEKFFDIVSRQKGAVAPDAVVIVATVKALKFHGGVSKKKLAEPDTEAVKKGFANLDRHIQIMRSFNRPVFVAINPLTTDTIEELRLVEELVAGTAAQAHIVDVWARGGLGGMDLAQSVWDAVHVDLPETQFVYEMTDCLVDKVEKICSRIYGADKVHFPRAVLEKIGQAESWGYRNLPVCMAKTQYSFSDNPSMLGRPRGFTVEIKDIKVCAGAGFIVVYAGDIMTMPGLPEVPSSEKMDIDAEGNITGLF